MSNEPIPLEPKDEAPLPAWSEITFTPPPPHKVRDDAEQGQQRRRWLPLALGGGLIALVIIAVVAAVVMTGPGKPKPPSPTVDPRQPVNSALSATPDPRATETATATSTPSETATPTPAATSTPTRTAPADIVTFDPTVQFEQAGDEAKLPATFPADFKAQLRKDITNGLTSGASGPRRLRISSFVIRAYRSDGFVAGGATVADSGDPVVWVKQNGAWTFVHGSYRSIPCTQTSANKIPASVWPTCLDAGGARIDNPLLDEQPRMNTSASFTQVGTVRTYTPPLMIMQNAGDEQLVEGLPADLATHLRVEMTKNPSTPTTGIVMPKYSTDGFAELLSGAFPGGYTRVVLYKQAGVWKSVEYKMGDVATSIPSCQVLIDNKIPKSFADVCWNGSKQLPNPNN